MISKVLNVRASKSKLIITGILMLIVLSAVAGCQSSVKTPEPPSNAESSYSCDVSQGFKSNQSTPAGDDSNQEEIKNLENEIKGLQAKVASRQNELRALQRDSSKSDGSNDKQTMVGHIDYLKIGDTELGADFSAVNPVSASQANVAGVLSSIFWKGGYADPLQFTCQVSDANKTKIAAMMHKSLSNTNVELIFSVYDYDSDTKSYYKCFHSNSVKLKGLVYKSGGELVMSIDTNQSNEVMSPKNFTFSLGVMPQDIQQKVHLAVSSTDKFVKQWGVAVGVE